MAKVIQYFKRPLSIAWVILCIVCIIFQSKNTYMERRPRNCVVLDKITSIGYKNVGGFYLVMKNDKGIIFDLAVQPSTYSQSKIGDKKTFILRDFDIKQTRKGNVLYFIIPVILISCCIAFFIVSFIFTPKFDRIYG